MFTVGIFILIFALIELGPFFINVFGGIIFNLRGDGNNTKAIVGKELIQPPILNDVPDATQSAKIDINGTLSSKNGTVEVYVNDDLFREIEVKDSDNFEIKNITLKSGINTIKARTVLNNQTSSFSQDYQVSYVNEKPKLEVSFPSNNQTFTKADRKITITGTTDSDNTILINSFQAIVNSDGKFSYLIELKDGDNQISIVAKNSAGITTQNDLKVTYNP